MYVMIVFDNDGNKYKSVPKYIEKYSPDENSRFYMVCDIGNQIDVNTKFSVIDNVLRLAILDRFKRFSKNKRIQQDCERIDLINQCIYELKNEDVFSTKFVIFGSNERYNAHESSKVKDSSQDTIASVHARFKAWWNARGWHLVGQPEPSRNDILLSPQYAKIRLAKLLTAGRAINNPKLEFNVEFK